MDYKDLMVGDYICLDGDVNYDNPIRIQQIGYQGENDIIADSDVFGVEDIIPIPLTEEILVKNGFGKSNRAGTYELNTDYYEIEVWDYSDGLWVVKVQYLEFSSLPYSQATVSYLHQFQHALRLCGIEKEIEL